MPSTREFLTHGLLPFVGRSVELDRIVAFWRGSYQAQGLRIQLLTGEAGIGKSRLIAETVPTIHASGGAVVHVRLVPESTTSVLGPIAHAVMLRDGARTPATVDSSLEGVILALRRLARLRATLLVIEDVQLLTGDSAHELTTLLGSLGDEPIAVLCAMRPVTTPLRAALERFVVDEIALQGLAEEAIGELWQQMTEGTAPSTLSSALRQTTLGNPLALRSALRGAIASGALAEVGEHQWRLVEEGDTFLRRLEESVSIVVEGLTLYLSAEQRTSTERLAMLGEVFSREAAALLIDGSERVLDELVEHGILTTAPPSAMPFARATSARGMLAFTHSLLHRALLERGEPDGAGIARVVAERAPIASLVPLYLLDQHGDRIDPALVGPVILATTALADWIDTTPDWRMAWQLLDIAERLAARVDGIGRRPLLVEIARRRLETSHRLPPEQRQPLIERLHAVVPEVTCADDGAARLVIAAVEIWHGALTPADGFAAVDALLERFPELRTHVSYASFLFHVGTALVFGDPTRRDMLQRFAERLDAALADPRGDPGFRTRMLEASIFSLFGHFRSAAERDATFARFDAIAQQNASLRTQAEMVRSSRLLTVGHLRQASSDALRVLVHFGTVGFQRYERAARIIALLCRWAWSEETASLEPELDACCGGFPPHEELFWRHHIGMNLVTLSVLRSEHDRAHAFAMRFPEGLSRFAAPVLEALGLPVPSVHRSLDDERERSVVAALEALASGALGDAASDVRTALALETVELYDLVDLTALIERAVDAARADRSLADAIVDAVEGALGWLEGCGAETWRLAVPLIERGAGLADDDTVARWRSRVERLRRPARGAGEAGVRRLVDASIVGTISVTPSGAEEPHRLQGGRMRRLFAVLVAAKLLREELDSIEMGELVADEEGSTPETRAGIVKKTVHRFRDFVGFDGVRTVKGVPHLDTDVVRVDLLEASALFDRAFDALRRNATLAARHALDSALAMTSGEVAFPSLYDSFFEAARDEFENRQRRCVLAVAQHLIAEEELDEACVLLRTALDALPGDDEIVEKLQLCLHASGRFLEAERMRLRTESVERG